MLPAWRPNVAAVGSLIATAAPSHAFCGVPLADRSEPLLQHFAKLHVVRRIGRLIAFEDDRLDSRRSLRSSLLLRFDLPQVLDPLRLRQPHDLERMVAGEQAVLVVVDRLAGPAQQPGRRVGRR